MADVSKIKLPSGNEYNIKDARITGVDSAPTSGSTNVVTSAGVYNAISEAKAPLQSVSYKSAWLSTSTYTNHLLMNVKPIDWEKVYTIKYRLNCSIENTESSNTESLVTFQFTKDVLRSYYVENAVTNTARKSFYQHSAYPVSSTGFNNGFGACVGIIIHPSTASYSYAGSSSYRLVKIDLLEAINCEVELFNKDLQTIDIPVNTSTTHMANVVISSATGLQETGDANNTYANYSFGNSYGICTTVGETLAKTSAISNYTLTQGAVTTIYFENAVPASSTLNVNTRGAKPIYYKNEPITNNIIKAGDTATFRYTSDVLSSGAYMLVALDRDFNDFVVAKALNDLESTKEDSENKVTSLTPFSTDIQYPSAKAVYDHINTQLTSVLKYKGTIGTGGTVTTLPDSHNIGDVYVVSTAGTYAGKACEVGDYIVCKTAGTSANNAHWDVINGENQVENKSASLAAAGSSSTLATVDGTNITVTTPSTWTGVAKTGTVTSITLKGTSPITVDSESALTTSGTRTISHANSGVTAGTYKSVTVDAKGHVTAGTNPTTLAGYGITDAAPAVSGGYLPLSGGVMQSGATIKLDLYSGQRILTLSGNSILHDLSTATGGYAGSFYSIRTKGTDNELYTTTGLGFYGGSYYEKGLNYLYFSAPGETHRDPSIKVTVNGLATFKNQVTAAGFKTPSGTSSQFLKADGSVDSNSYLPENQAILSRMQDDATHRTVTDTDKTNWNNKQSTLISGSNIKTINNTSLLGSGNISIPSGKSAYDIWLDAGNTGTESDFLESLKGSSGYSGAAGELQVVNDLTTGGATAALSAEMGKILADMINAPINIDLSSITVNTGWAISTSTGKWASSSSYKYILVPVENYYKIIVYTSSSGISALAWLKSNASPVSGGTPDYASETAIWTQTAGTTETYEVPSDAKYLYIYVASRYPDKIIGINYNTETTSDSDIYVNSSENDFEIVDENKNPIVVFNDGHIKTLNFDSSKLEKLPYVRRNFFSYNVNCTNFLTTNFTASSINYYDPIALYEDNAILYLPASYSNQGPKTKLIIYCKEGSTYMTEDHDSILTNPEATRYFLYQGYAILAADGVPDGWKEALKIGERAVGNYVAVQSTLRAFEYVKNNYNIDCDNVFIFGYSQGGMYAENVIDNTDLPIRAAVLLSPALSMRYHQWDAPTSQTIDGTSYTKGARLNIARIFNFPEVTTNAQLLALAYDPDKVCGYDPWVRNVDNPYDGFIKGTSVGTELWGLPSGASLDSITMKKYTKCPTKIWVAENDNVLGVDITKVFVKAIRNTGQVADLQLFSTGEHHIQNYQTAIRTFVENGENVSLLPLYLDMAAWYYNFGGLELK